MLQTTLCYLNIDGKTLMLHRVKKKNDVNHDKWIGIGGKFEHGESPEECMLREFKEETGLTLTKWAYRGLVTFVSDTWCEYMHLFSASAYEGEILPCEEGTLEWVDTDKLTQLPIWEGDKVFLRLLKERDTFFSLKLVYEGERLARAGDQGVGDLGVPAAGDDRVTRAGRGAQVAFEVAHGHGGSRKAGQFNARQGVTYSTTSRP